MKVVFDVAAGRLAIEGEGDELIKVLETAHQIAPAISQIQIVTSQSSPDVTRETVEATASGVSQPGHQNTAGTLRQFARSLSFSNIAERIAAIAYYVNVIQGRPSFSPKEMDGWFTMCGFQKPAQMPLALFDAKRKYGYADNVARGMWRISNQGENLIIAKIEEGRGS